MIRTDLWAACDNLIVERARETEKVEHVHDRDGLHKFVESGQYGDEVIIENLQLLGSNSTECIKMLNRLMHYGIRLSSLQEGINARSVQNSNMDT